MPDIRSKSTIELIAQVYTSNGRNQEQAMMASSMDMDMGNDTNDVNGNNNENSTNETMAATDVDKDTYGGDVDASECLDVLSSYLDTHAHANAHK